MLTQAQVILASRVVPLALAAWLCGSEPALAQFIQQGEKLVGDGAVGATAQGTSVALSADGNTAMVGGAPGLTCYFTDGEGKTVLGPVPPNFNCFGKLWGGEGAAWVFTRANGKWTQQGERLIGAGAVGPAGQGTSVAISADGNTAIVGGPDDNSTVTPTPDWIFFLEDPVGAAWIFTRTNGKWTQQGEKLIAAGAIGGSSLGTSVGLSADGDTAIVGGYDDSRNGAAWLFSRTNGKWTQQSQKLVVAGGAGIRHGVSVALSADGSTAILSALRKTGDPQLFGPAAWVFIRSSGQWIQQGEELVGNGEEGDTSVYSVALSANGETAVLGGRATYVFTRRNGVWVPQAEKLDVEGWFGGLSISSDGNTVVTVGERPHSNSQTAAWVFTRENGVWVLKGAMLAGTIGAASGALSGDARTALVGEPGNDDGVGGALVFIRNGAN